MIPAASRTSRGAPDPEARALRRLYRWAFLVRVVVGLLAYALTLYADLPIVEDAQFYEEIGYEVARDWLSGRAVDFDTLPNGVQTARLLVTAIAAFYYVTGGLRALPLLLIAYSAITALVPLYVHRVARELRAPEAVATGAGWLVAWSPAFVFWSGSLYKEGLTLLLLSVASYHTLRLQLGWRGRSMAALVVCVVALWEVRFYLAILLALAVVLSGLWGHTSSTSPSRGPWVFARQVAIVSAFALIITSLGVTVRTEHVLLESNEGVLVNLDARRAGSAKEARSGYLQEASVATPEEALQYFPVGLFYFLTVPFPWQAGSIRQSLIIPENLFWLGLYPLTVVGIRRALKSNPPGTMFLLVMAGGMCGIYALLSANIGTTYRMRSQVWLLLAPFAVWGWEIWREHWRRGRQRRLPRGRSRLVATRGR